MTDTISPDVLQRLRRVAQEKGMSVDDLLGYWLDGSTVTHPQTEAYLQGVLDSSPLGIMGFRAVRDVHHHIIDFEWTLMNTHSEIMVGHKQADLLGKRLLQVMPMIQNIKLFDKYVDVVETGNRLDIEEQYAYHGASAWYHITAVKLDDGFVVTFADISEQKQAQFYQMEQERLRTQFRKEQEHNALIQRSISALAHDIRTPLAVVSTSKDLLLRHFDKLTEEKRREKLESIGRQLEFAMELIDDTVMTVRGELSKRPFRPTPTQLSRLCEVSIAEVGNSYNARHRLHFHNLAGVNQVVVDDILVSRILMNLLSNTIKYSPPNAPVRLELDKDESHLILRVVDKGIGIAPEHLPHIFEPFYRVDTGRPAGGTGLGLSIVKECVERHNGRIEVESVVGVGTTFTVYLPYVS